MKNQSIISAAEKFAASLQSKIIDQLREKKSDQYPGERVSVFVGNRFIKINTDDSGKFMCDMQTGHLFFTKSYGQVDRRKDFGHIDDINKFDFDWDGYSIITKGSKKSGIYGYAGPITAPVTQSMEEVRRSFVGQGGAQA